MATFSNLELQANHIERLSTKLAELFPEQTERLRKCKGWVKFLASKSPEPSMYKIEYKKDYEIPEDADQTYEIKDIIFRIEAPKQCILQVGPSSASRFRNINDGNSEFQTVFIPYEEIDKFCETAEAM